ncbi:hypothetical protein SMAX5B_018353 [Scophthalmus maximus]|uniref:Uncharacterized protein n=1 Tax=Scophthalmus maximus TaxID=52904 RepID=A0A2U9C9M0_SCOMX|nr:hypothetical protein SMAX5B_018353 [Scophthalmus maximus]
MDYWRITQLGGQGGSFIIRVAWYWSNLWKDCFTDSTAVTNCRDFPVLWTVTPFVQGVRGLLMCGLTLGFFGVVLCFFGMECTYIGGADKGKDKMVLAGAVFHLLGVVRYQHKNGLQDCGNVHGDWLLCHLCDWMDPRMCSMIAFSYYGNKIRSEFDDPHYKAQKFEIGVGVFVGWGGSTLLVVGGLIYSIFAGREGCHSSSKRYPAYQYPDAYTVVPTRKGPASLAGTKRSESRKSRNTSRSGDSSISGVTSITRTTASNSSGVTSITKTTDSNEYV